MKNGLKYHQNPFKYGFLLGFGPLSDPSWYYHWQFRYFHIKLNKFRRIFEIRQYFKFYRPSPNDVFLSPKPFKIRQIGDISPSLATLWGTPAQTAALAKRPSSIVVLYVWEQSAVPECHIGKVGMALGHFSVLILQDGSQHERMTRRMPPPFSTPFLVQYEKNSNLLDYWQKIAYNFKNWVQWSEKFEFLIWKRNHAHRARWFFVMAFRILLIERT